MYITAAPKQQELSPGSSRLHARSSVAGSRGTWGKGCRWRWGLHQPVCQLCRVWSCQAAISSCEKGLPDLPGSGTMVGATALLPWLTPSRPPLHVSPPVAWPGFYKERFPRQAVSCTLSAGSTSGPAAARTAALHCVWLQYKVPLQVFWWVFSCLFFA